jgi:hypothetical protein
MIYSSRSQTVERQRTARRAVLDPLGGYASDMAQGPRAAKAAIREKARSARKISVFVAFRAYALQVTLTRRLHALAPGLTTCSALEKFAAV